VSTSSRLRRVARRFLDQLAPGVVGSDGGISLDEVRLVDAVLRSRRGPDHTLIDVGAHHGGTLGPFARRGWSVHAFEPDSQNRAHLEAGWGAASNVTIDPRAVSDAAADGVVLYRSPTSTGISALSSFHAEHAAGELVEVTTLERYADEVGLDRVDVLKTDVEGHDLLVLSGFPWGRLHPWVVVCEFEDAKTRGIGYEHRDLGDFLVAQGYRVLLSEWYPIVEYGRRHRHRRFAAWPAELLDEAAWGNFVAFASAITYWRYRVRAAVAVVLGGWGARVVARRDGHTSSR